MMDQLRWQRKQAVYRRFGVDAWEPYELVYDELYRQGRPPGAAHAQAWQTLARREQTSRQTMCPALAVAA